MRWACALGLLAALLHLSTSLLLGAFNIKSFGEKKASDPVVMGYISEIVCRYDIILIQEVRDPRLVATNILMNYVNSRCPQYAYHKEVSNPLGPSTYKERYLFLYRTTTVSLVGSYYYNDIQQLFSRPPFIVKFNDAGRNIVLIPQHTSPKSGQTWKEIDALYDVVTDARAQFQTNNIMLLGDFNAGCSYVSRSDWQKIRLFTDKKFDWLIPDSADTTVSHSKCPYDRIVVTDDLMKEVVSGSAGVFDYELAYGLTPVQAKAVSDHFPVEVALK
ncbi:deoxyribonuclease-1-like [Anoplopoma fimbria]|uniref:deoxyribonuclease-1-like n=1 Tax=Anoplopoma fimbria TaxID=229290 RepID=UPI0023EB79B3|nr:deoxyribonuclease-1-like [Anoplopoma fimbria]